MENDKFTSADLNSGGTGDQPSSVYKSCDSMGEEKTGKETPIYWTDEDWGQSWNDSSMSPPFQTCLQYGDGVKRFSNESLIEPSRNEPCEVVEKKELSTEEILRIAGARFIQSSSQMVDVDFVLDNSFDLCFTSLSDEQVRDVELAELLLASAEKVGSGLYDSPRRLLNLCSYLSSNTGNPVQRLVYYLSEALRCRIEGDPGEVRSKDLEKERSKKICEAMMAPTLCNLIFHQVVPFCQISHFAGI
ncbi:hypothetical protein Tsubulata_046097 [Turnera subulata]|uniref:Uncharacterized protein n=1 Tax=Turnera subulata TaxID=218843 RepID=A0A9Q0FTS4_9ROSI|nr:hypothetical protein Tsubulata_046097 [Turnera subulata]